MGIPPDEEVADRGQHDALRIKASKLPTRRPWEYLGPLFVPVNPQRIGAPICLDQHLPTRTFIRSSPYSERSTSYRGAKQSTSSQVVYDSRLFKNNKAQPISRKADLVRPFWVAKHLQALV